MQNELTHYGILGMRWGVRRTDAQLGHPTSSGTGKKKLTGVVSGPGRATAPKVSTTAKMEKAAKSVARKVSGAEQREKEAARDAQIKKMTNAELQNAINRLNLEKQYKSLTSESERDAMSVGKKLVNEWLLDPSKGIAKKEVRGILKDYVVQPAIAAAAWKLFKIALDAKKKS